MPYTFNPETGRYRDTDTGRFVKHVDVIRLVEQSLKSSENVGATLSGLAGQGALSGKDFESFMRSELKGEYIRQYLAGIGGRAQMTKSDWSSIGGMLKEQYGYLKGFAAEVAAGSLSEEQIAARSAMYINSAREAFERAKERTVVKAGYDLEAWRLGFVRTEHCDDCVGYEAMSWQPVGTFPYPGDGSTVCLTNCKCYKVYKKSSSDEVYGDDV